MRVAEPSVALAKEGADTALDRAPEIAMIGRNLKRRRRPDRALPPHSKDGMCRCLFGLDEDAVCAPVLKINGVVLTEANGNRTHPGLC